LENLWVEAKQAIAENNFNPCGETKDLIRAEHLACFRLNKFACLVLNKKIQKMWRIELDIGILEALVANGQETVKGVDRFQSIIIAKDRCKYCA
jgi:hypothetical protein